MNLGLDGQAFVIGGGSAGLGFAVAKTLVDEGSRVLLVGRDAERLNDAQVALGPSAEAVVADIGDSDTADRAVEKALTLFGRLDGALINTGGPRQATVRDVSDQEWESGARELLLGPVRLADRVIRHLAATSGGSLLFVLSTSVKNPIPGLALSNMFRPALAAHLKDLADAYGAGDASVRVNGVLPYRVSTPRSRGANAVESPLARYGTPEEFGAAAAFLLSPAAGYVTGSLLPLDGGRLRSL